MAVPTHSVSSSVHAHSIRRIGFEGVNCKNTRRRVSFAK